MSTSLVTKKISGAWWFFRENKATSGSANRSTFVDSLKLSEDIGRFISGISTHPVHTSGGFGDVHIGKHRKIGKVALKRPRNTAGLNAAVIDRFLREAETWRGLVHPYVLPFVGIGRVGGQLYIVSPYIDNGTLANYIETHSDVDRPRLLRETCDAVKYLHRSKVIHGDIKANNILVSDDIHALLCDFGLAKTAQAVTSTTLKGGGSSRWQAPEMWDNAPRSYKSDVYSFGMTVIEVLTGSIPFPELRDNMAVMKAVLIDHKRPSKPKFSLSTPPSYAYLWDVAEMCCVSDAAQRLDMDICLPLLEQASPRRPTQAAEIETTGLMPAADLRKQLEANRGAMPSDEEQAYENRTPSSQSTSLSPSTASLKPRDKPVFGGTMATFLSPELLAELDGLVVGLAIGAEAAPAIERLKMIYLSIAKLADNQDDCLRLADKAKAIFHLIKEHADAGDATLTQAIDATNGCLNTIHSDVIQQSSYSWWNLKGLRNRGAFVAAIHAHEHRLNQIMDMAKENISNVLTRSPYPSTPPNLQSSDYRQLSEGRQSTSYSRLNNVVDAGNIGLQFVSQAADFIPAPAGMTVKLMGSAGLSIVEHLDETSNNREEALVLGRNVGVQIQNIIGLLEAPYYGQGGAADEETQKQLIAFLDALKSVESSIKQLRSLSYLKQGISHKISKPNFQSWDNQVKQAFDKLQRYLLSQSLHTLTNMTDADAQFERLRLLNHLSDGATGATSKAVDEADLVCHPQTRRAVLDDIDRWLKDPLGERILWVSGVAGCGKSAVAATIPHHRTPTPSAAFYFNRGWQGHNQRVISSLSRQLAHLEHGVLERTVLETIKAQPYIAMSPLTTQFQHLLINPLKKLVPGSSPVLILLDGLDEWENHDAASKLVRLIGRAHSELLSTVRFVVTSRNEYHIVCSMREAEVFPIVKRYELDKLPRDDALKDIRAYLDNRFSVIRSNSTNPITSNEHWPKKDDMEALVNLSGGLFLWAATVMTYIDLRNPDTCLHRILDAPEEFTGLDELYRGILQSSIEADTPPFALQLLQKVLGFIVVAPIPVDAMTITDFCADISHGETLEDIQEEALARLASFLILPKDPSEPIRLSHKSAVHFATNEARCTDSRFFIRTIDHHQRLARTCLIFLNRDLKQERKLVDGSVPPPLQYACRYWALHLSLAGYRNAAELSKLLDEFAGEVFTNWAQVMTICGFTSARQAVLVVEEALSWSSKLPFLPNPKTQTLLNDMVHLLEKPETILAE